MESFFNHFKSESFHLYSFHTAYGLYLPNRKYIHFYNHPRFQKN
ncbi:IS3 family transposase [Bacillus cereus group sp. Bc222]